MVLRLALLICDTPLPSVVQTHGDYLAIFTRFFKASLPDPQVEFSLDGFDVVNKQEYPPLDTEYDGIVISGSGEHPYLHVDRVGLLWIVAASAYADLPWITRLVSYIRSLADASPRVKIIGIYCRAYGPPHVTS
jgi:GMP synthase-like glutamine amidotransferase